MQPGSETVFGIDFGTWKTILLVVFFSVFVLIVLRLLLSRSSRYAQAARLPLEDDPAQYGAAGASETRKDDHGG